MRRQIHLVTEVKAVKWYRCRRRLLWRRPRIHTYVYVFTWAPLKAQRDRCEAVTTLALFASRIINLHTNDTGLSRNSRFAMRFRVSVKAYYIIYIYTRIRDWSCIAIAHWGLKLYRGRWSWWISETVCFRFLIDYAISISVSNTRYNI